MCRRPPPLSTAELSLCRRAYEAGATFQALADQRGMSEAGMRRLLRSVGVEVRPRGKRTIEIERPDEALADWRAGLSCRQIAAKHGLASHHYVARFLCGHGIQLRARARRIGCDMPPMVIRMRTAEERHRRAWTPPELGAIEQALAAGRAAMVRRGRSGLPELYSWREAQARAVDARFLGGRRKYL